MKEFNFSKISEKFVTNMGLAELLQTVIDS